MLKHTQLKKAADHIKKCAAIKPVAALVLGSGLGDYAKLLEKSVTIPFSDVPGMPVSGVKGHEGNFVLGQRFGKNVIALQGRVHCYEGYSQSEVTIPIRLMSLLGVKTLLLTNAAGGVNPLFKPGELMLLTDHINFSGANPLTGPNLDKFGPRFPDASNVYDQELRVQLSRKAAYHGIMLEKGVYMMFNGPSYETPAEIRFARLAGADAVGMSTVPEALVASHCGMKTLGISCITNMAAGILDKPLSHDEVMQTAKSVKAKFEKVLDIFIKEMV